MRCGLFSLREIWLSFEASPDGTPDMGRPHLWQRVFFALFFLKSVVRPFPLGNLTWRRFRLLVR
jgi:hypothetical protein